MWWIADSVVEARTKKINYKQMVLESEVEKFVEGIGGIKGRFEGYRGRIVPSTGYYNSARYTKILIDFLDMMFRLGFNGKEVCDYIILKYLAEEKGVPSND